jgi:DNA-binding transcriptional ArsR family regulator
LAAENSRSVCAFRRTAPRFAALGHVARLSLLIRLGDGAARSITQLTEGSDLTRQAVTKHLRILRDTGLVRSTRHGREHLFRVEPDSLKDLSDSLDAVSRHWDLALSRLKAHVED